ncbi:F-box/LRR-repeat protein 4 [Abeliophyllum distichum]|uniref:F-box/LRR-repeat protein 4 n=1 Tax=Abeliophyllum distichum TaxID=126358 RepID=A0ABD1T048_9LAMI
MRPCKLLENFVNFRSYWLYTASRISQTSLDSIVVGCTELMHLEVNGYQNIGTSRLQSIVKSCIRLSELALHCQKVENDAQCEIGLGYKDSQSLHLEDCSGIGDESICCIARGYKNLKKLYIS